MHLCSVSRLPRLNKRRIRNERLWQVLVILEEILKQFKFSCKIVLDVLWREYFRRYSLQFLNHQLNLIPRYCAISEWLTTHRYSRFWKNEHIFSCFTTLVTVSEGSKLLPEPVLLFEILTALTIVLEEERQWKRHDPWVSYLTMNF